MSGNRKGTGQRVSDFLRPLFLGCLLGFFFLLTVAYPSSASECLEHFQAVPSPFFRGGISKIEFQVKKGCLLKRVDFQGKTVPYKEEEGGRLLILVGQGLKAKPGKKKVAFYFRKAGKDLRQVKYIALKDKKYPKEYLKVKKKMVSFPPRILKRVLADQKAVKEACSRIRPVIYWDGSFIWPVKSKVLSQFGLRRFFNGQPRSPHSGIDLRAKKGTPIRSPNAGIVALVRDCYLSGNTVVIDHGGGLYTLYAHMSKVKVRQGQMVEKGEVIGLSGATGRITGPHLHWGVSLLGQRVDPVELMRLLGAHDK